MHYSRNLQQHQINSLDEVIVIASDRQHWRNTFRRMRQELGQGLEDILRPQVDDDNILYL